MNSTSKEVNSIFSTLTESGFASSYFVLLCIPHILMQTQQGASYGACDSY